MLLALTLLALGFVLGRSLPGTRTAGPSLRDLGASVPGSGFEIPGPVGHRPLSLHPLLEPGAAGIVAAGHDGQWLAIRRADGETLRVQLPQGAGEAAGRDTRTP